MGFPAQADVARDERPEEFGRDVGETGLLECFCTRLLREEGVGYAFNYAFAHPDASPAIDGLKRTDYDRNGGRWCRSWAERKTRVYAWSSAAICFIVAAEMVMEVIAGALTELERHGSRTRQMKSLAVKLSVASIVNTGLLTVLINGNLDAFDVAARSRSRTRSFGVFAGASVLGAGRPPRRFSAAS